MARFAIVNVNVVENVILAGVAPVIPGRSVVALGVTEPVSAGDTYNGSVFTPRVIPPDEARLRAAINRLTAGRDQLRNIRVQAQAAAGSVAVLNITQLTTQFRQLAGATAILAQTLMDIERVAAYNEDDGQE